MGVVIDGGGWKLMAAATLRGRGKDGRAYRERGNKRT